MPIAGVLRDHLDVLETTGAEFAFGGTEEPINVDSLIARAKAAWKKAKLDSITLHECRHTFASLMIAADVNAKALSTYMGHANIGITLDRYGHLMPGNEEEAASLLDAYLERANTRARLGGAEAITPPDAHDPPRSREADAGDPSGSPAGLSELGG